MKSWVTHLTVYIRDWIKQSTDGAVHHTVTHFFNPVFRQLILLFFFLDLHLIISLVEEIFFLLKAVVVGLVGLDERRWISSIEWSRVVHFVADI